MLALYGNLIDYVEKSVTEDALGSKLRAATAFMYMRLRDIEQTPAYLPIEEFNFLLDIFSDLRPDSNTEKGYLPEGLYYVLSSVFKMLCHRDSVKSAVYLTLFQNRFIDRYKQTLSSPYTKPDLYEQKKWIPIIALDKIDLQELGRLWCVHIAQRRDIPLLKYSAVEENMIRKSISAISNLLSMDFSKLEKNEALLENPHTRIKNPVYNLFNVYLELLTFTVDKDYPDSYAGDRDIRSNQLFLECLLLPLSKGLDAKIYAPYCLKVYQCFYDSYYQADFTFKNERIMSKIINILPDLLLALKNILGHAELALLLNKLNLRPFRSYRDYSDYGIYLALYGIIKNEKHSSIILLSELSKYIAFPRHWYEVFQFAEPSTPPTIVDNSLNEIPFELQAFLETSMELRKAFIQFVNHCRKVNSKTKPHQQRNMMVLFYQYGARMQMLIQLMGVSVINNMRQLVADSLIPLEQTMDLIPIIDEALLEPLKDYFSHHLKGKAGDIETIKLCLIVTDLFIYQASGSHEKLISLMKKDKPPAEFLSDVLQLLLKHLIPDINPMLDEESILSMFKRVSVENLVLLFEASKKMENDEYRAVFLELIKSDLLGTGVGAFLHDTKQKSSLGKAVATHNQSIHSQLLKHKIDPAMALSYRKKTKFIILPRDTSTQQAIFNPYPALWSYLTQLNACIPEVLQATSIKLKTKQQLESIQKNISELSKKIEKSKNITSTLSDHENLTFLVGRKIIGSCRVLLEEKTDVLTSTFIEFAQHSIDNYDQLQAIPISKMASNKTEAYCLSIEQWKKEHPLTFLLGNEVHCCLSTDGAQFQAMVQRRMDDAMIFHVARDGTTNKPVALIWLYLAETDDKKIVLMANFFEIRASLGMDIEKRKAICAALLQFTQEYLNDNPNIAGMSMRRLTYGLNMGDLNQYPIKPLEIKKVGGAFIPSALMTEENPEEIVKKYFLESLKESKFHEFSSVILTETMPPGLINFSKLIHETVVSLTKEKITFDDLVTKVIEKHSYYLRYFYKELLKDNLELREFLKQEYESAYQQPAAKVSSLPPSAKRLPFFNQEKHEGDTVKDVKNDPSF